jgi:cyclin E
MLDVGSLDFTYSVLATSALYHTESEAVALAVSGYTWPAIARCVRWMSAFALALRERSPLQPKCFHGVQPDDAHHLQVSARALFSVFFLAVLWIRIRIKIY